MASIRLLKKEISALANELAAAALFSKAELNDTDIQKVNSVLAEVYNFEEEFRKRAHHYDAKGNPKLVKKYFDQLYIDMENQATDIVKQIEALN